jgi:hypothetical protein
MHSSGYANLVVGGVLLSSVIGHVLSNGVLLRTAERLLRVFLGLYVNLDFGLIRVVVVVGQAMYDILHRLRRFLMDLSVACLTTLGLICDQVCSLSYGYVANF